MTATTKKIGSRGVVNAEALLAAAHRLVLERGENFTTQDLIKEADVALQTFYRHFGGKDQLLVAVVGDLIRAHCEQLAKQAEALGDPVERLRFYVTSTLRALEDTPEGRGGAQFMTSQHWKLQQTHPKELAEATAPFAHLIQRELESGTKAKVFDSQDPERDAWIINKLVMSAFHEFAFAPDDPHAATAADDIWRFCLAAIGGRAVTPRRTRGARR